MRLAALPSILLFLPLAASAAPAAEHMSYLDNGTVRLGINLDIGGAITWVSRSGSQVNLINSADWGRQIQMSHYSGPNPFAPNGKKPNEAWAGLGWNPIQSGDCYGHRSRVMETRNSGGEMYVKCIPMQWPLDNEPGECTFECWIRLDGAAAHVRSRMVNHRSDTTQYSGRDQELPAVYTNGPWWRLITYSGARPYSGEAVTQIPAQFPWAGWRATENWAALVDEKDFGLGIWEPGVYSFIGGFAGKPGAGGPKDGPTGYIAPLHSEILDYNIAYEYRYTLILGTVKEIRQYVYAHATRPTPPSWRFTNDRQHWIYANATDAGWPIGGELNITKLGADPQLLSPPGLWSAEAAPTLYIEGAWRTTQTRATVFWTRHGDNGTSDDRKVSFDVKPDGQYRVYEVPLAKAPGYTGTITGIRIDPVDSGAPGDSVRIRSIGFRKPPR